MNLNFITYLTLSIFIFSCSNPEEKNNNKNTDFSEESAKELANIIHSSDNNYTSIIEEVKINTKSSYSDSIWKLVTNDLTDCINPNIKNFDNKEWSYCNQDYGLVLYQVEYIQDNIAFTEKYLTRDDQLIYAVEWEKRTAEMSDVEATYWNCEYIIQNDLVVDHISLGMGKTEDESFNIQDIVKLWSSRKVNF